MRKIILSMMVSVDGYIEGLNNDINWHVWDDEMGAYMMDFFSKVDTFLYGRKSYELMVSYWPDQTGEFAQVMNETPKIVFSRKLEKVEWNSRLMKGDISGKLRELKQGKGKDMVLFAGADIAETFVKHDLIDEYRLIVNPVVLGTGTPLFKPEGLSGKAWVNLKLTQSRSFECGNILLCYVPQK